MVKKNNLLKSTNISLLFRSFTLIKLLKRREIFVLLNKLFFLTIYFRNTLKVGICLK